MTASPDQGNTAPGSPWPPPAETPAGETPAADRPTSDRRGTFDRFKNEMAAGGSVTEREPSDQGEPIGGGVQGLIAGLGIIALMVWLAVTSGWMFLFLIGILVSVFLHESGHFVTARLTGMKATQFFIGFGPRLWSFQRGETEYGVRLLPLGAFVRIIGMNNLDTVPPEDEARTYRQKSYPKRMLVITAGSLMHLAIAVVLFFAVFSTRGDLVPAPGAEVNAVAVDSGAAAAGIQDGDIIVSVGGNVIGLDGDLGAAVRASAPGDTVPVVFRRDGVEQTVDATLGVNDNEESEFVGTALLGVNSYGARTWDQMSVASAAGRSFTDLFPNAWESTKGIVQVVNPINIVRHLAGSTDDLSTRPTTLVGVTQVSDSIGQSDGIAGIAYLLAAVNVFVGVFNMFPLLPLDGGHAAIATYERFRERRTGRRYFTDVSKLMPFTLGVVAVLLFLFMSGLYLDVTKPL